jgi:SAM-dependent methyltransferase
VSPLSTTFEELLSVLWLRPETAMWREIDIRAMRPFIFRSPSLDLGCGDGIFSFIRAGGGFAPSFDAFRAMAHLDRFFENVDVFDAFDESVGPEVTRAPGYMIDCGFDHKENLLKKTAQLGLYRELRLGDANMALPFDDRAFNSVFSNIVYWLDDPQRAIVEIARVLRPGGQACLMLPNRTFPEFSFYSQLYVKTGDPRWAFLEKLDRGRFADNIRQARSGESWEGLFSHAGLRVGGHATHISRIAAQVWDIGLRPMFPVLRRMTEALPAEQLPAIKRDWIATLRQFLEPIVEMDGQLAQGMEPAFHCYILEK